MKIEKTQKPVKFKIPSINPTVYELRPWISDKKHGFIYLGRNIVANYIILEQTEEDNTIEYFIHIEVHMEIFGMCLESKNKFKLSELEIV